MGFGSRDMRAFSKLLMQARVMASQKNHLQCARCHSLHWSVQTFCLAPEISEFADERIDKQRFPAVGRMCGVRWRTYVPFLFGERGGRHVVSRVGRQRMMERRKHGFVTGSQSFPWANKYITILICKGYTIPGAFLSQFLLRKPAHSTVGHTSISQDQPAYDSSGTASNQAAPRQRTLGISWCSLRVSRCALNSFTRSLCVLRASLATR